MKVKFWKTRRFVAAVAACIGLALGQAPVATPVLTEIACAVVECQ